jgi:hypothetical protein
MRIVRLVAVMLIGAVLGGPAAADEPQLVVVTNFPEVQRIDGSVTIEGPLESAVLRRIDGVVASPIARAAALNLEPQGTVATDGYTSMVVSLVGEVQGAAGRVGSLGVVLVPDDDVIVRALRQDGAVLFPLEASAAIPLGPAGWVSADSAGFAIAFPSYRVYLYNTSDKSVAVTVYLYLTNS